MLQRIALIVAVLSGVWRILSAYGRRLGRTTDGADRFSRFSRHGRDRWAQTDEGERGSREELIECAVCGTMVPASHSRLAEDGRQVCSEDCRRAAGAV
jgi:hypothetical protein